MADKPLTYKQFEHFMFIKLNALRELAKHLGMIGPYSTHPDPQENKELIMTLIYFYLYEELPLYSKYALASLLDYYLPEWREIIGFEYLGAIVNRNAKEVALWKKQILKRDNSECQLCGSKEYLEVHHKIPWAEAPDLRLCINNGIVLCVDCHAKQHEKLHNLIISRKAGELYG